MNRNTTFFLFFSAAFLLTGCNTATPEKYFDIAVLNSNMITGFADQRISYELESPSVKMGEDNGALVTMQRVEVVNDKIKFVETNLGKLKGLKETEDAKDILQTSIAMFEFVLGAYKTDYMELAKLYDNGASKEKIQSSQKAIHDKYFSRFDDLYSKLIDYGKLYAKKHEIKVNWAI